MKMAQWFLDLLDAEGKKTRRALEHVPEGRDDWTPHPKSMPLGRLALLVAGLPGWVSMIIEDDQLDLNPPGGSAYRPPVVKNRDDLLKVLDDGLGKARRALLATSEEELMKPWRLLVAGKVVSADPRQIVLRDTFGHLAHHRGQLTVYLRLNDATVPAIYGPSADENRFD